MKRKLLDHENFIEALQNVKRLTEYQEKFDKFLQTENDDILMTMNKMSATSSEMVEKQKNILKNMILHIDSIIAEREKKKSLKPPTQKHLAKKFNLYTNEKLPSVSSPFPDLCGAIPLSPDKQIPPNSYL